MSETQVDPEQACRLPSSGVQCLDEWVRTHQQRGQSGHHGVQQDGRDGAAVLRPQVRLGVRRVVAEEALHMHGEGVRVLEVVGQHDGPGHDHQLEV
ncbi:hypothetical protein XENOCAPTIV_011976 [Xenoophorus captivus]|uniref:Uncharacterized protein n=1 Tax=Xenoophorus captivus TaxID=1517983 RepID=A0ABV0RQA3_9TELE